jgi:hypothetical protein
MRIAEVKDKERTTSLSFPSIHSESTEDEKEDQDSYGRCNNRNNKLMFLLSLAWR